MILMHHKASWNFSLQILKDDQANLTLNGIGTSWISQHHTATRFVELIQQQIRIEQPV